MANVKWVGGAAATAESRVWTIGGTWANGETISAAVGGRKITVTLGATSAASVTAVANALVAAFNGASITTDETRDNVGSSFLEMDEITAANVAGAVTFTHDTAGVEFAVTLTEASTSGTVSAGTVTTATGPNSWSTPANWSGGAVPVNSDNVYIEDNDVDILYGLSQASVTLTSLRIASTYTGRIGLDAIRNRGEETQYVDYRTIFLSVGGDNIEIHIGKGDGAGSPRIRLNATGTTPLIYVYATGDSAVDGHPALFLTASGASGVITVNGGSVWIGGEIANTVDVANIVIAGSEDDQPDVWLGSNGSASVSGAVKASRCTLTYDGGATDIEAHGSATVTLLSSNNTGTLVISSGATVNLRGANKTPASIDIYDGGTLDATGFGGSIATSSTLTMYGGSTLTVPDGVTLDEITIAAGVAIAGTKDGATAVATLDLPSDHSITINYA